MRSARRVSPFDQMALAYDNSIDWDTRLRQEMPLLVSSLADVPSKRTLDLACGTGRHSVALAKAGAEPLGIDRSPVMVQSAKALAVREAVSAEFLLMDMQDLIGLGRQGFGLAICLGNSLSLLPDIDAVLRVLKSVRSLLAAGGCFVLQVLNFDEIRRTRFQFFPAKQGLTPEGKKLVFMRFFNHGSPDGVSELVMVSLKQSGRRWQSYVSTQQVLNLNRTVIEDCLRGAGFESFELFGDYNHTPLNPETDRNIVAIATRGP